MYCLYHRSSCCGRLRFYYQDDADMVVVVLSEFCISVHFLCGFSSLVSELTQIMIGLSISSKDGFVMKKKCHCTSAEENEWVAQGKTWINGSLGLTIFS